MQNPAVSSLAGVPFTFSGRQYRARVFVPNKPSEPTTVVYGLCATSMEFATRKKVLFRQDGESWRWGAADRPLSKLDHAALAAVEQSA